ncbi:MAG: S8 family peptidase [Muribaculaceae bacterium]|nr:S8 family peptidase [Muribaculaceae bacterium]
MNKTIILAVAASLSFTAAAKGLDLQSRTTLQRQAVENAAHQRNNTRPISALANSASSSDNDAGVMGFVKIEDGYTAQDLEADGLTVLAVKGRIAIVAMPRDSVEAFAVKPAVRKLTIQRPLHHAMKNSRQASGIDDIHQGTGLDMPYTGNGVLTLIVDQGMDPNHVAFLDDNGKSRVKYLAAFDGTADRYGVPNFSLYGDQIYDIDQNGNVYWYPTVDKFTTDEKQAFHGTHTMNILAGGYKGKIQETIGLSGIRPVTQTIDNPYYGAAPEATIAASCGSLQDACIAYGLNGLLDFADYAKQTEGMPSVVSLSLGASQGPHDPRGLMNQFLDECGNESIIVVASGNEGDLKIALNKTFAQGDTTMATMIYPFGYRYDPSATQDQYNTYIRTGAVMVYSADDTPFTLRAFIMTGQDGNYRRRATFDITGENGNYFVSDAFYTNYVGGTVNSTVARYFDGYIGGGTMLDEDLGRYYGAFDYYLFTNPETGYNDDGSEGVIVGFEVIGVDGQRIDCYGDGENTWMSNYGMDGYMDGQYDGTISDMAVGHNVLVVGAYNKSLIWTCLDGSRYGYDESHGMYLDDIAVYSSFGTLADGRTLPHVCAPGTGVISAISTPYVNYVFNGYEQYIPMNMQAKAEVDGRTYYWKAETGTSMSTPLVAGSIALWLEADPTLTIDDVRDIISRTSIRDEKVLQGEAARWGAGKFDALAGLKEVIRRASVDGITIDGHNDRLIVNPKGNRKFNVFVGEATSLHITVYDIAGSRHFSSIYDGCEADIDLSALPAGVYIIQANGHSKKIMLN